jgi:maltose O-acetyltransferase
MVRLFYCRCGHEERERTQQETCLKTEKEKMLGGELYDAMDPQLVQERQRARDLLAQFNTLPENRQAGRTKVLATLFGSQTDVTIQPPFYCDYGPNITLGSRIFMNFNCTILDVARVQIGDNVLLGPGVQIYAATHPLSAAVRRSGLEAGKPVTIGADVWIGGGAIICPGVNVGARSVIGAGSVVTRDIPSGVFAAGNPCRVIRALDEEGEAERGMGSVA